ncbi:Circumsporozoite protein [Myxococcus hansupus]|uniref:Circumsporozoite protein n=1 Tax=Pseudomyxococcus hansupus TaxID=1297742 RepID=A0A0H4WKD2_9BACT|nr:hypothetical protein [Myxococcus hansupus]AKQ63189.1 Circumsporozoite protein [Myxococcus hansupus]
MAPIDRRNSIRSAGHSQSVELSRTREMPKPNRPRTTTTTTRSNNETTTTQTTQTRTSRKGREITKTEKPRTEETKSQGIDRKGEVNLFEANSPAKSKEWGAKEKRVQGTGPGGIQTDAYFQGPSLKVEGGASAKASLKGIDIDLNLKIDANLVKAGASATKEFKVRVQGEDITIKVKLGADGQVGANGELKLKLNVGKDGVQVKVGAEGFAGAKGSLSGNIEVGVNGRNVANADAKVTFAAGAMAGAEFEAGLTHFKAKAYAAVGVGVGVELAGKVNAGNLLRELPGLVTPW